MTKIKLRFKVISYFKNYLKYFYYLFFTKDFTQEDRVVFSYLSNKNILNKKATIILDIGANVGVWTSKMLGVLGKASTLMVFEPSPKANKILSYKFKSFIKNFYCFF